jgi:hypothetical protein
MCATASGLADVPWTQHLAETPPWSPWRLALGIAVVLFSLLFASEWILGRFPLLASNEVDVWTLDAQIDFRIVLVMILIIAHLPAAFADGVRSTRATAVALVAAATALLSPLRGARRAIQAAKRDELARNEDALRRARAELEAARAPGVVADLVAWRTLVSDLPEWPLDAPTLRRFILYLAIPVGSWVGGALVDQFVEVVLR